MNNNAVFIETKSVLMTPDKKCILRGGIEHMTLCLVGEQSRLRVKTFTNGKAVLATVNKKRAWYGIHMTPAVQALYGVNTSLYDGKLEVVKLRAEYFMIGEVLE